LITDTELPAAPIEALSRFERFAYRLARMMNRRCKGLFSVYQQCLLGPFFRLVIGRARTEGLEQLRTLPRGASILLVSNHRSFFDFFALSTLLYYRAGIARHLYFPIRANFYYQTWLGLLLNAVVGGWSMYPPIFRERPKRPFNRASLDEAAEILRSPGALVGLHPEGTRNKGPDPYALLPAQPGVGRVALGARSVVVPAFVLGMSNRLLDTFWLNWLGKRPVIAVFGAPLDLADLYAQGDRPAIQKRIADRMRDAISALGERERTLRLSAGFADLKPPPAASA
jgi:1-acyl-sn-glycerol-3-phosphate acyltransferase